MATFGESLAQIFEQELPALLEEKLPEIAPTIETDLADAATGQPIPIPEFTIELFGHEYTFAGASTQKTG